MEHHGSKESRSPWLPSAPLTSPLPTGIICLVSIYGTHHNPTVWPDSKVSSSSPQVPLRKGQAWGSGASPALLPREPEIRAGCRT